MLHVSQCVEAGVAHVVADYVGQQCAAGWSVYVACPPGDLGRLAAAAGAVVIRWDAARQPGPSVAAETLRLHGIISDVQPDVLHLHSAKAGLAGRLATRNRVPTFFTPHAWSWLTLEGRRRSLARTWERTGARWTESVICVSTTELEQGLTAGVPPERMLVLENDVDPDEIRAAVSAGHAGLRSTLGIPEEAPLAVCPARLAPQKGQEDLLDGWEDLLAAKCPAAHLVLVGDGPGRSTLTARSRNLPRVWLVGSQPRSTTLGWMSAASVVVCPSRYEGMSLVPMEAAALGRPVVATDVSGMRSDIPAVARALVPPGDSRAFARAVCRYLDDPALARAGGAAARSWMDGRPQSERAGTRVLDVYRTAVSAR